MDKQPLVEIDSGEAERMLVELEGVDWTNEREVVKAHVKAFTAKFGQREIRLPEKVKEEHIGVGTTSYHIRGREFNQAIDKVIELNKQ